MSRRLPPSVRDDIIRRYRRGETWGQIVARVGVSHATVSRTLAHIEKHTEKRWRITKLAIDLYTDGASYKKIMAETGLKRKQCHDIVTRHCESRRRRSTTHIRKRVGQLYTRGLTDGQISTKTKLPLCFVRYVRAKILKLPTIDGRSAVANRRYKTYCERHGSRAKARWDADKFDAYVDGAPRGVTKNQWLILKYLRDNGPTRIRELAAKISKNYVAVKAAITKMKRRGLVKTSDQQWRLGSLITAIGGNS